jgi:hypothetical protein
MMAARKIPELFQLLLAHGGDDQPADEQRLERLIEDGDLAEVEGLLQRRPDLIRKPARVLGRRDTHGPASRANRAMADLLLRLGARVPTVTKWGPYYYFKHYEMAAYLLERGNGREPHELASVHGAASRIG